MKTKFLKNCVAGGKRAVDAHHAPPSTPPVLYSVIALLLPHGITEWLGQELTFKAHLFQLHCSDQGHLHVDQVAHSPVQNDLECFQG